MIPFRLTVSCFDRAGILRLIIPVQTQEEARLLDLLWKGDTVTQETLIRCPKGSCGWADFYRDGELYRSLRITGASHVRLWAFHWEIRGKNKRRRYTVELRDCPVEEGQTPARKPKHPTSSGPKIKDLPF